MRQSFPVLALFVSTLGAVAGAAEAGQAGTPMPVATTASARGAQILGVVRDEDGRAIAGARVLAVGTALVVGRSDASGRFRYRCRLVSYILRAARAGYVSTYREAVRVRADRPLHRTITLYKEESFSPGEQPGLVPSRTPPAAVEPSGASPSEVAWRLRHLPRTVLRDERHPGTTVGSATAANDHRSLWEPRPAVQDLRGTFDFLTTSSLAIRPGLPVTRDVPRGVAYVVVGAPVGSRGDWSARAAFAMNEAPAWTFVGEYRARGDERHQFRAGASYGAQTLRPDAGRVLQITLPEDVLSVGGVYGFDRWTAAPGLTLSYGGRFDRYDYLVNPNLMGGSVEARQAVSPHLAIAIGAARHRSAPGADQFRSPHVAGVWLPADRTFSTLDSDSPLGASIVDRYHATASVSLNKRGPGRWSDDGDEALELHVSTFVETVDGQIATLFGLKDTNVGHYYVGSGGSAELDGVVVSLVGALAPGLRVRVAYTNVETRWLTDSGQAALSAAGRLARSGSGRRGHDLTTSIDAHRGRGPRLHLAARVNSAFGGRSLDGLARGVRFAVAAEQPLPVPLLRTETVNLVVGARNLLGDPEAPEGFLDELLTVSPPLRVSFGLQVRF